MVPGKVEKTRPTPPESNKGYRGDLYATGSTRHRAPRLTEAGLASHRPDTGFGRCRRPKLCRPGKPGRSDRQPRSCRLRSRRRPRRGGTRTRSGQSRSLGNTQTADDIPGRWCRGHMTPTQCRRSRRCSYPGTGTCGCCRRCTRLRRYHLPRRRTRCSCPGLNCRFLGSGSRKQHPPRRCCRGRR